MNTKNEYTQDQLLALPLQSDDQGQIEDRHGENIADVWQRTLNGAPADEEDDAEAEELAKLRAAEIVKRCNAYPEMQSALSLCLLVLNEIPNRSIRGDRNKTTYQLASRIGKLLDTKEA